LTDIDLNQTLKFSWSLEFHKCVVIYIDIKWLSIYDQLGTH